MNKYIIISLVVFFLISFSYLSFVELHQHESDSWAICFDDPKSPKMDFVIKNDTDNSKFEWEIISEEQVIESGSKNIEKGETLEIKNNPKNIQDKRITVKVISGGNKKEIYKNIQ